MNKQNVFIAGGGTGGHLYPGIAIARALLKKQPNLQIYFVGTSSGLETKIIPREGFPLLLILGGKLNFSGRIFEKIKTLIKLPLGLLQSLFLLLKHRPIIVLGVGGYASGPMVLAASFLRIKTAIWEPNAFPGMANRLLAKFVDRCYVVFEDTAKYFAGKKVTNFGMPVRDEIENTSAAVTESDRQEFRILSFGGSQGSRAISTVLSDAIIQGGHWTKNLRVIHQIGNTDFAKMKEKYKGYEGIVEAHEYIYDMPKYYRWADLVIARGGASTITELAAFGVPAIIIPLPAADHHQQKNAETLVRAKAGKMILQSDLTVEKLVKEIEDLRANPHLRQEMRTNIRKLFQAKAAEKISEDLLNQQGPL